MKRHMGFPIALMIVALAACGGQQASTPTPTPQPTDTPAPTQVVPTRTPEPTPDMSALTASDLWATVEAIEAELAIQERNLGSASGAEGASIQATIDRLRRSLREARALAEAAEDEGEAGATAEATEETSD